MKLDFLTRLKEEKFPEFDDVPRLSTADRLSSHHFIRFFTYEGIISHITNLVIRDIGQAAPKADPDAPSLKRYEYHALLTDDRGTTTLRASGVSDTKSMHEALVKAHNSNARVEVMVLIAPFPEALPDGTFLDNGKEIPTLWPVRIQPAGDPEKEDCFYRDGKTWKISYNGIGYPYEDLDGLYYLHELLVRPNQSISALTLYISRYGLPEFGVKPEQIDDIVNQHRSWSIARGGAAENLDSTSANRTLAQLSQEQQELERELKFLDEFDHDERTQIEDQLAEISKRMATIEAGAPELIDTSGRLAEKSRQNVQRAIKKSIDKMRNKIPKLAELLWDEKRIKTGGMCIYNPSDDDPLDLVT